MEFRTSKKINDIMAKHKKSCLARSPTEKFEYSFKFIEGKEYQTVKCLLCGWQFEYQKEENKNLSQLETALPIARAEPEFVLSIAGYSDEEIDKLLVKNK